MCTAVDGGSIHRTARRISAASNQTSTTPITSHRTKDRRKPLRSGVLGCVSGCSGSTPMPDLTGEHRGLSQSSPIPTVCPEAFPIKASASRNFMRSSVARLSSQYFATRLPRARKRKPPPFRRKNIPSPFNNLERKTGSAWLTLLGFRVVL